MATFATLHEYLVSVHRVDRQELYYELARNRDAFIRLFALPQDAAAPTTSTASPVAQILSRHLSISLNTAQILTQQTLQTDAHLPPPIVVEKAVQIYYAERSVLLDCLELILERSSEVEVVGSFAKMLWGDMLQLEAGRRGLYAERVLATLDDISRDIENVSSLIVEARSETDINAGTLSLGSLKNSLQSLRSQFHALCGILHTATRLQYLPPSSISKLVLALTEPSPNSTRTKEKDHYVLSAIILALLDPDDSELINDPAFPTFLSNAVAGPAQAKRKLRPVLQLAAGLFTRRYVRARVAANNHVATEADKEKEEESAQAIRKAIEGDAFASLFALLPASASSNTEDRIPEALDLKTELFPSPPPPSAANGGGRPTDDNPIAESLYPPFALTFHTSVLILLRSIITYAADVLRLLRIRQEDLFSAATRTRQSHVHPSASTGGSAQPKPRTDIPAYFILLATLYNFLPEETAREFWDPNEQCHKFLRWAIEVSAPATSAGGAPAASHGAGGHGHAHISPSAVLSIRASSELLSALCKGRACAEAGYNYLSIAGGGGSLDDAEGGIEGGHSGIGKSRSLALSWRNMFRTLEEFIQKIPGLGSTQQTGHQQQQQYHHQGYVPQAHVQPQPQLTASEIHVLVSYLRPLFPIASWSSAARLALVQHSPNLLPRLIELAPCSIPLELKAVIWGILEAFCKPGAGPGGVGVVKAVWAVLGRVEAPGGPAPSGPSPTGTVATLVGVKTELDEVETPARRYPSTLGFLRLLSGMVHSPRGVRMWNRIVGYEPVDTVPDDLGAAAVWGFTRFVVEDVLIPSLGVNGSAREYAEAEERGALLDAGLSYVENALAGYTLEDVVAPGSPLEAANAAGANPAIGQEYARKMILQPGWSVLVEILSGGVSSTGFGIGNPGARASLLNSMVEFLKNGAMELERVGTSGSAPIASVGPASWNGSKATSTAERAILRILRILQRVLEIQSIFLEVLGPLFASLPPSDVAFVSATTSIAGFDQAALTPLDTLLVWSPNVVVAIAICIAYAKSKEVQLMAIRVLGTLAGQRAWTAPQPNGTSVRGGVNRLAVALARNQDSEVVRDAVVRILNEEGGSVALIGHGDVEWSLGAGAPVVEDKPGSESQWLGEALRWEVLDLLLANTGGSRNGAIPPGPNIAHFFLGFDTLGDNGEMTLEDPHAQGGRTSCLHVILTLVTPNTTSQTVIYETHPVFAEKAYRLIWQLCNSDLTRPATMRYLRTREHFFVKQLKAIPTTMPAGAVETWTKEQMDSLGVGSARYGDEVHIPTTCESLVSFLRLRAYLIESIAQEVHLLTSMGQMGRVDELLAVLFTTGGGLNAPVLSLDDDVVPLGQGLMRMVELFDSFDFEWEEGTEIEPVELALLGGINLLAAVRPDESGCELIDRDVLLQILQEAKVKLASEVTVVAAQKQLQAETAYILASCTVENHRRMIQHAKGVGLDSWRRLLDVCLAKCFNRLPSKRRDSLLFDLLDALPRLLVTGAISTTAAVSLAETTVTLMTKLREDRMSMKDVRARDLAGAPPNLELPPERMVSILKGILECVLDSSTIEFVRGNLYAALINFLHLVDAAKGRTRALSESRHSGADDSFSFTGSVNGKGVRQSVNDLEFVTLEVVNMVVDKLVHTIARDAIDGTEVWKSVAFTLLDALVRISRTEKQHRVLAAMVKQGSLNTFLSGIRDIDTVLDDIYLPDPADLNSLFVYEARLSLLIRIAQTSQGGSRLLEHRLFLVLAQCNFISAKPELERLSQWDRATFLPSALQRYHQLLLPALQLADSVVTSVGHSSKQNLKLALDFLIAHRETFVLLLKDPRAEVTLSVIREQQLLVSFCAHVHPFIDRAQLGPADFGPLHSAILSLASRSLGPRSQRSVVPSDDTELALDALMMDPAGQPTSRFSMLVDEAFESHRDSLLTYLCVSSNSTGAELRRVLSPATAVTEDDSSNALATQPSLGDVVYALSSNLELLSTVVNQIDAVTHKLSNQDSVSMVDINKVIALSGSTTAMHLDTPQKRAFAFNQLERTRNNDTLKAHRIMHTVEVILLLIWRHLDYFQSGRYNEQQLRESTSGFGVSRLGKSFTIESLNASLTRGRNNASPTLLQLVSQLETIQLPAGVFGSHTQSRQSFIQVVCRKLRDMLAFGARDANNVPDADAAIADLPPY